MNKFIYHVATGDLPPKEAEVLVVETKEKFEDTNFFPGGCAVFVSERGTDSSYVETVYFN